MLKTLSKILKGTWPGHKNQTRSSSPNSHARTVSTYAESFSTVEGQIALPLRFTIYRITHANQSRQAVFRVRLWRASGPDGFQVVTLTAQPKTTLPLSRFWLMYGERNRFEGQRLAEFINRDELLHQNFVTHIKNDT